MLDKERHLEAVRKAMAIIDAGTCGILVFSYVVIIICLILGLFACFVFGQVVMGIIIFLILWLFIKITTPGKD